MDFGLGLAHTNSYSSCLDTIASFLKGHWGRRLLVLRLIDSLAAAQATRHHCCLQLCPFSRRMGGNVAGNRDQNLTPRRAPTPLPVLLHASLKHLIGMELGVLAQYRARKRGDKRLHRVTEHEVTGNEPRQPS